jgi:hypothetical protein
METKSTEQRQAFRLSVFTADIGLAGDRREKFGQQRVEEVGLLEG